MDKLFDVVVVGGGPGGCATAIALHNLGVRKMLILEASDYTGLRIGESIPPNSRHLFEELGIWQSFSQQQHMPCLGSYSSWGSNDLGFNDYLFNPLGHGWHLDRLRFDQFLVEEVEKRQIPVWRKSAVSSICSSPTDPIVKVNLRDKSTVKCRFIVDATGRGAKVARQFGATKKVEDQLVAVSAYYDSPSSQGKKNNSYSQMTLLEAVDYGWWYLAYLPNNKVIVTVATDADMISQRELKGRQAWFDAMSTTRYISQALGTKALPEQLHSWVAQSAILNPPAAKNWLAVGDAASTFDPISSQGIYKAIQNGIDAALTIKSSLNHSSDGLNQYRQTIGNNFIRYLEQKAFHYDNEQRWPESEFWQKRQNGIPAMGTVI